MGLTKIGYLDHGIGFRTKKYPFTRILVTGHDQTRALPPHPTVLCFLLQIINDFKKNKECKENVKMLDDVNFFLDKALTT